MYFTSFQCKRHLCRCVSCIIFIWGPFTHFVAKFEILQIKCVFFWGKILLILCFLQLCPRDLDVSPVTAPVAWLNNPMESSISTISLSHLASYHNSVFHTIYILHRITHIYIGWYASKIGHMPIRHCLHICNIRTVPNSIDAIIRLNTAFPPTQHQSQYLDFIRSNPSKNVEHLRRWYPKKAFEMFDWKMGRSNVITRVFHEV